MSTDDDSEAGPAEAASLLREAYGFDAVEIGPRLHGGYANDLHRITGDGRRFVLRIKYPPVADADIAWEHRLMRLLAERLSEVVAPVTTRDGGGVVTLENRIAWLVDGAVDVARARRLLPRQRAHPRRSPARAGSTSGTTSARSNRSRSARCSRVPNQHAPRTRVVPEP